MTHLLKVIIGIIATFAFMYGLFAFVTAEVNSGDWSPDARLVFAIVFCLFALVVTIIISIIHSNNDE